MKLSKSGAGLAVLGGLVLAYSSWFRWVCGRSFGPCGLSDPSPPAGAEHEIAFWAGVAAVAVGCVGLIWRSGIAGSAVLLGAYPLFFTLLRNAHHQWEPQRFRSSAGLHLAIAGSTLVVIAGVLGLAGAAFAFRHKQDTWTPPTAQSASGSSAAALAHLGILIFAAVPVAAFFTADALIRHPAETFDFQPSFQTGNGSGVAVLAHLGVLIFAVTVPVVVFCTVGQRDAFVRRHAAEAFNFQLTFVVLWVVAVLAQVANFYSGGETGALFLAFMIVALACAVSASVVAAIRAHCGRPWRYLLSIPILKSGR